MSITLECFAAQSVLEEIQKQQRSVRFFSAHFKQENYNIIKDKIKTSVGILKYMKPGLMKWVYSSPDDQAIIIGKKRIWIVDFVLENVILQDIKKVSGMKTFSYFRGTRPLVGDFKVINDPRLDLLEKNSNRKYVYLQPIDKNPDMQQMQLGISKKTHFIEQYVIISQEGNYRKITFDQLNFETEIDKKEFEFQIPESMEIIEE